MCPHAMGIGSLQKGQTIDCEFLHDSKCPKINHSKTKYHSSLKFVRSWHHPHWFQPMKTLLSPAFRESGGHLKKTHSSVCLSVRPSVTKTLTLLISSEVLMIEHWYLACMILVTSPFNWHHAVTLTLTFDLLQGQRCCHARDHNSPNLLVRFHV